LIAGVDGTSTGWIALVLDGDHGSLRGMPIKRLSELPRDLRVAAVDIPIVLQDRGERESDRLARKALGTPRGSSVFPSPIRAILGARTWDEACEISERMDGRRISKQSFAILPKVAEADALVRSDPWARQVLYEVHPELSFAKWSGAPMVHSKRTVAGRQERQELIAATYGSGSFSSMWASLRGHGIKADDLADAFAALWSASRILKGEAERFCGQDAAIGGCIWA
jgi:predicted RNase H-like nuclease